jgi:SAM-dependent methyltransferase
LSLEIGAGTGNDGLYFQNNGLDVTCTDLSPDMVNLCREKGLKAYVMDFLSLDFPPGSFDAIYALNCLLHVPTRELPIFDLVSFKTIPLEGNRWHFQSMVLRRKEKLPWL